MMSFFFSVERRGRKSAHRFFFCETSSPLSFSLFLPLFQPSEKNGNSLAVARVDVVALVLEHAPLGVRRARGERVVPVFNLMRRRRRRRRRRCDDSASHRRRRCCLQQAAAAAAATLRQCCCRSPRQKLGPRGAPHRVSYARSERDGEGERGVAGVARSKEWKKLLVESQDFFFPSFFFPSPSAEGVPAFPVKTSRGEQNASPPGGPAPARRPAAPRAVVIDTALRGPGARARRRGPGRRRACRHQIRAGEDDGRAAFVDLAAADVDLTNPALLRHRRRPRRGRPQHGRHRRALLLRVHAAYRHLHGARAGVHEGALHCAAAGKEGGEGKKREERERTKE